jgi:hypothetical protein
MRGNPYDKKRHIKNIRLFTHLHDLFLWYQIKLLTPVGNLTKTLKSRPTTSEAKQKNYVK